MKRSEFIGKIKKPIPYYGSKERAAPIIIDFLHGDKWATQHIEPFVGSNACLFYKELEGVTAILNDFDGNVTNLWRSLKYKPEEVAKHVLGVANTINQSSLDLKIQRNYDSMLDRMHADIDYCDPVLAAHYLDLCAGWIGGGAGFSKGPWTTEKDDDGYDIFVRKGNGIICKQYQYTGARGVSCQQVRYSSSTGIISNTPYDEWFASISKRLDRAIILSHDWKKIMNLYNIVHKKTALLLDPPYAKEGNNGDGVGYRGVDGRSGGIISSDVRKWLIDNNEALKGTRICLCGRGYEHDELIPYGYTKIPGVNTNSFSKRKEYDAMSQEWLWVRK